MTTIPVTDADRALLREFTDSGTLIIRREDAERIIARARAEEREQIAALAVKESADERLTGKHHAKNFRLRDANMCRGAAEALKRFAAAIRARGEGGAK